MKTKLKVLDLTHRLPGPLAGKILADLGHEVFKIEDKTHGDPFMSGAFSAFDKSFEDWYQKLNRDKKVLKLDFKSESIKEEILKLISDADILLLSLSSKLKEKLGLDIESLKKLNRSLAVVELEASATHKKAMHDLNALAISGHLSLHVQNDEREIVSPPFFPIAGIAFGQQVATTALSNYIEALAKKSVVNSVSYLYESTVNLLEPFWSKDLREQKLTKFLHNGAYPCYSLYRLKDANYVALAAVEEKFWTDLIELFKINLPLEKRFNTDSESFKIVAGAFAKYTADEIEKLVANKELCLSIVRKIA